MLTNFKSRFKEHRTLFIILVVFGLIYCSISLVNHYNFRTYARELGVKNNEIYDYAHFRFNECTLNVRHFNNKLSDHFSLLPMLFSPLYWVFGSYTLLIIQILSILWGGIGIYKLFLDKSGNKRLAILSITHFLSIWGIYSALAFDYHDNILGAMFVPWLFYYIYNERWKGAAIYFILILISKESLALWSTFIFIGLIVLYFKDKSKRKYLVGGFLISIIYFLLVIQVIMPSLSEFGSSYGHGKYYQVLGNSFGEAFSTIFTKPWYVLKLLFINHIGDPTFDGIKTELYIAVLLSGGLVLIRKPQYLIMLIPIFAQKMFNDSYVKWGLNAQYSIEFVPIISVALFSWIIEIKKQRMKIVTSYLFVILTFATTLKFIDSRKSKWYNPSNQRFYQKNHYVRDFDVKEVHRILKIIPDNAIVSAQTMLTPHLAFRDRIYHFPNVLDANYIALLPADNNTYFISREKYDEKVRSLKKSAEWEILIDNGYALILKRKD